MVAKVLRTPQKIVEEPDWTDVEVFRLPMSSPDDVTGLGALLQEGQLKAEEIQAIIAQTEGTGYARGYTALCMQLVLAQSLGITTEEVFERIPLMMIGLCGGLMSPHYTIFAKRTVLPPQDPPSGKRLAIGVANTPKLLPEDYGRTTQVEKVAAAVQEAIEQAGITNLEDVHCVEVKCPAMTPARIADAQSRGKSVVSTNLGQASSFSKAACALGVGVALGEIPTERISDAAINRDFDLYTTRGSVSAGGEQSACRVLVMGNSPHSTSPYRIGHGVMQDQLDTSGIYAALKGAGLESFPLTPDDQKRIAQVFVNCGADAVTSVRGRRHTIHSDFLAGYAGIMAKAVANAVVASVVGDPMILASAGFEHQGAPGSNLVAAIVRVD